MAVPLVTYTGQQIDPANFKKEQINLYDIAVSLSRQRRYAGHTAVPWSVGQHALLCAMMCDVGGYDELSRKLCFLHDHEEFVMQDVIFGIKRSYMLKRYKTDSLKVSETIYDFFGLLTEFKDIENKKFINAVDQAAYVFEALTLRPTFVYTPSEYSKEVQEVVKVLLDKNFTIPISLIHMSDEEVATAIFEVSNVIHAENTLGAEVDANAERLKELSENVQA